MTDYLLLFEKVKQDFRLYAQNYEVTKYYKRPINIDIFVISVGQDSFKPIARAKKFGNSYEIQISADFIDRLYKYAEKISHEKLDFFFGTKELKQNQKEYFKDILFFTWINFIMFHEWSHIIAGHLDYKASKSSSENHDNSFWIDNYQESQNNDDVIKNPELNRALELEADSKASLFILSYIINNMTLYNDILLREINVNNVWSHFYYILSILFNFLEDMRPKNSNSELSSTHPSSLKRLVTMTMFISGELETREMLKEFRPVNEKNLNEFFTKHDYIFQLNFSNKSQDEICAEQVVEANYIAKKVGKILKNSGISDYRLINGKLFQF